MRSEGQRGVANGLWMAFEVECISQSLLSSKPITSRHESILANKLYQLTLSASYARHLTQTLAVFQRQIAKWPMRLPQVAANSIDRFGIKDLPPSSEKWKL